MPVPAVIAGGMPTVSSGSQITDLRHHLRVEDDLLGVGRVVGEDGGAADLGAGAGGGRHGDDRRDAVGVGPRPPVADVLEVPDRPGLAGHEGDELADVEPRAAAEGDDAVMAAGLVGGDAGGRGSPRSGWAGRRRRSRVEAGILEERERLGGDRHLREAGIGDEERPCDARRPTRLRQLGDAAGAEADGGRVVPVGAGRSRRHDGQS